MSGAPTNGALMIGANELNGALMSRALKGEALMIESIMN